MKSILNSHLNILLNTIIHRFLNDSRCILIFTDKETNTINLNVSIPLVNIQINNNIIIDSRLVFQNYGCQDIIIFHNNFSTFLNNFEKEILLYQDRFNLRKYIIVESLTGNRNDLLQNEIIKYLPNILFIKLLDDLNNSNEETYQLYTHKYFGADFNKIEHLDLWFSVNSSFQFDANLFPDRLNGNQLGKELRLVTFTYKPYSIIENDTYDGIEMLLILEYAKLYNFTPVFTITEKDNWGEIYDNWTGTGLMGKLVEGDFHIAFAALYRWEEAFAFLDYSKPIIRTGITCLVPAPKLVGGWLTPIFSFSTQTWIGVLISMLYCTLALFIVQFYYTSKNRGVLLICDNSIITVIRIFLLQSANTTTLKYIEKIFVGNILIAALFLTSFYTSEFSSIMTIPRYEGALKTVDDLSESEFPWGANSDAWLISLQAATEAKYRTLIKTFVVETDDNLRYLSQSQTIGFSVEYLQYGHFSVGDYIKSDIIENYRLLEEDLYWDLCIYMTKKSFVYLPSLDNLILRATEAGLIGFWESEVVQRQMDMKLQRRILFNLHHTSQTNLVRLKWMHVEGAFAILVFGYILGAICLTYEIFLNKNLKKSATIN